jgi:solute carrier family 25 aspartate/glutamate transporter 12/13
MKKTISVPFDMNGSFTQLYFGRNRDRSISPKELSQVRQSIILGCYISCMPQFLHDYHNRYSKYVFKAFDKEGTGFISSDDFCDMIFSIKVGSRYDKILVVILLESSADAGC